MRVRSVAGDFVVKYKGDEGVTGTENGDFGVFIPDFDGERRKTLNGFRRSLTVHERAGVARWHRVDDVSTRSAKEA